MREEIVTQDSLREKYLNELLVELSDPFHKRLIEAYQGDTPVQSMESQLGKILTEVLHRED